MSSVRGIAVVLLLAALSAAAQLPLNRPAAWAQPIALPGLPNFFQVSTNLYRGAQPTAQGMARLQALGVHSVINLRLLRSDQRQLQGTRLKVVNLGMVPWHVRQRAVVKFLQAAINPNNQPLFVHCEHGADRTGLMCAMYRLVVCGWTKQEAIAEMEQGGFNFNPNWKSIVSFIEKADVPALKRSIGLPARPPSGAAA